MIGISVSRRSSYAPRTAAGGVRLQLRLAFSVGRSASISLLWSGLARKDWIDGARCSLLILTLEAEAFTDPKLGGTRCQRAGGGRAGLGVGRERQPKRVEPRLARRAAQKRGNRQNPRWRDYSIGDRAARLGHRGRSHLCGLGDIHVRGTF